jgi:hypothetical protein
MEVIDGIVIRKKDMGSGANRAMVSSGIKRPKRRKNWVGTDTRMEWLYFYVVLGALCVLGVFGIMGNIIRYKQLERRK